MRLDRLARDLKEGMAARGVDDVVLEYVVAGSTMSAIAAVSVRNCSCTHRNRSSRAMPWRTVSDSGATAIGLVFCTSVAVTGGPAPRSRGSPVRMAPMRD